MKQQKDKLKLKAKKIESLLEKHRNAITSSRIFRNMCAETFRKVDLDHSGKVDVKEAYVAVLLFYLKMSIVVKGLTPPTINDVRNIVHTVSFDNDSEQIDEEEFVTLIVLLFEHLVGRVLLQMCVSFAIIPIVAAKCWDLYYFFYLRDTTIGFFVPRPVVCV